MTEGKECVALFISCILTGFLTGFLFDAGKALRIGFKLKKAVPVIDVVFWGMVVALSYKIIFTVGEGQLRGFCFFGIGGGILVYFLFFSRTIGGWLVFSARWVRRCFLWIFDPLKVCFLAIKSKFDAIVQNLQKNEKNFGKKTLEKSEKIV